VSLFDKTIGALDTSMDMRQVRQNVISGNIANAETPGYKAKKMDFEEALSRALDIEGRGKMTTSHGEHFAVGQGPISRVTADVYDNPDISTDNDLNTVDMEKEMTSLAENSVLYRAAVQLINKKMATLRYAATEGSR
jgi:flagellar basal-body rod protein FlgB